MDFVTVRELRTDSARVWDQIEAGEEFVITRNGKPFAIMVPTQPAEVEDKLRAIRAASLGAALRKMQRHAVRAGLDQMTLDEINAEIAAARQERATVQRAVIDTNALVSAGINPTGTPGQVLLAVERLLLMPVVSAEVLAEYREVLTRPRFGFAPEWIGTLLDNIEALGLLHDPLPIDAAGLPDAKDAPFIALARYAACPVITGNLRHFPAEAGVAAMTPAQWLAQAT